MPGISSPSTSRRSVPSARTSRNRVAPPVTIRQRRRRNPLDRQRHDAIEQRPCDIGAGAVGEREGERGASVRGERPATPSTAARIGSVQADRQHRLGGRVRGERRHLRQRHRVVAADDQQERWRERPGGGAAAGPASARARPAVPIHSSGPARACPARTMASRSSSAVASHRKKPRPAIRSADGAGRIGRPRPCSSARRSTSTGCHAVVVGRPPVLAAALRDPLLRRKGGRDHRAREVAALEARRDLVDGAAAQQRVDLLVGEVGAAQRVASQRAAGTSRSRDSLSSARLPLACAAAPSSQSTGSGPATPTSGAAASSAPVRSSATIRTRVMLRPGPA